MNRLRCGAVCDFRHPPVSGVGVSTLHARRRDQIARRMRAGSTASGLPSVRGAARAR
jgi:hypothetical protein